ncbi:hypothetical protein [Haloarcula sp. CBA1122]|uniref:hypothetical protein n=1 Tax=Haloarcula sp. CBA1122 TaxID=2668069 RepID=UPI00130BA0F4|nr:hypothetical protein [Haloarcula sp. CBA1122]MUV49109.1 hypothetical protein [Haloarcula sp. CBA1122]
MTIEVEDETGSKSNFKEIFDETPESISILPTGIEEEDGEQYIIYPEDSDTVRKLIRQSDLEISDIYSTEEGTILVLRSEELIIPTLWMAYTFTRDNWDQIKYAIDKISNHYSEQYNQEVKMSVEQERSDGTTTRLTYTGPPEGLDELSEGVAEIIDTEEENE